MTEKQNFLRIVKGMYESIKPIDFSEYPTKIEKLKELNRFLTEFEAQTKNVEKMLNTYIKLGLLSIKDRQEMVDSIKQINGEYLEDINV